MDYMLSYLVVILGIVLGLLVVAKASNRRDRERPAGIRREEPHGRQVNAVACPANAFGRCYRASSPCPFSTLWPNIAVRSSPRAGLSLPG